MPCYPGFDTLGPLLLESALLTWSHQPLAARRLPCLREWVVERAQPASEWGLDSNPSSTIHQLWDVGRVLKELELVLPHLSGLVKPSLQD